MKLSMLLACPMAQTYPITAVIDSALCIGAGGSSGTLADKSVVRNAEGRLIIPGSHLKGRLRHECEKIARGLGWTVSHSPKPSDMVGRYRTPTHNDSPHCLISEIFGDASLPSCLIMDDLICVIPSDELPEVIRPGVTINRSRGTAEDQKLYFLETSPANLQLKFIGEIHLVNPPIYATALICAGLQHIRALGGGKSAGLGALTWQRPLNIPIAEGAWAALGGASS
jgi:CRISPR/Cas system CSM-associated protein Csm3 (group 7 of RAMP superfamily)